MLYRPFVYSELMTLKVKLTDDRGNHAVCTVVDEASWPAWVRSRGVDSVDGGPGIGPEEVIQVAGTIYVARWDYNYEIFNVVS